MTGCPHLGKTSTAGFYAAKALDGCKLASWLEEHGECQIENRVLAEHATHPRQLQARRCGVSCGRSCAVCHVGICRCTPAALQGNKEWAWTSHAYSWRAGADLNERQAALMAVSKQLSMDIVLRVNCMIL